MRKAEVYYKGKLAGLLSELSRSSFTFQYLPSYLADDSAESISLTLPKRQHEYFGNTMFPFFCNMLAEGMNLNLQAVQLKIDPDDVMGLLLATAGDDSIGAVTLKKIS